LIKIGINGFGRIGRMVLKASLNDRDVKVVAVNDLGAPEILAYLFKYDSVHGKFNGEVRSSESSIFVNGNEIKVFNEKDPSHIPWGKLDVDVVIESTGIFLKKEDAMLHIKAGAKKVLLSAPAEGDDPVKMVVLGINEHEIDKKNDIILSNASCTTNCLAPIVKVLNDNFGVKRGFFTTVHAYTADQSLMDAAHNKDPRRGRSAAVNIVPTSSGAAKSTAEVVPQLKGKLTGIALRVPVADGSITDFVCEVNKHTSAEEINALFKNVADYHLKGVVEYSDEPLVSSDILGNRHSAVFDSALTSVSDGTLVKVVAWYDNEYGYACRMVDIAKKMF